MISGSCLCSSIKFEISGQIAQIQICHCSHCRKAQGGPFGTNIPVEKSMFKLLQGDEFIKEFEHTPGKVRAFCSQCGSPLFSKRESMPDLLRIRAGTLDEPLPTQLAFHFFVDSKASWWPIHDKLPQYPEAHAPVE